MSPDTADALAYCFGVDHARPGADLSAIAMRLVRDDAAAFVEVFYSDLSNWQREMMERIVKHVMRDTYRPSGYSQSHWRRIVKDRGWTVRPPHIITRGRRAGLSSLKAWLEDGRFRTKEVERWI